MSYILQEKAKVKGSEFYVFIEGSLTDLLVPTPVESWFMVLFSVKDDQRIGTWPVDDWRSANNTHTGSIEPDSDRTIDLWLRKHNADGLLDEVKTKIKKIQKGLSGHRQYMAALKSGPPTVHSGDWPDIDEKGDSIDF